MKLSFFKIKIFRSESMRFVILTLACCIKNQIKFACYQSLIKFIFFNLVILLKVMTFKVKWKKQCMNQDVYAKSIVT